MRTTKIEWTERTWNPVTGCTKRSNGCKHCYAEAMARRLFAMGNYKYRNGFKNTIHPEALEEPLKWRKASVVFVCSMGDLFHEDVPFEFIDNVMDVISKTPQHTYQLLTKRAERMAEYFSSRFIPQNVWLGVTVEDTLTKFRIDFLRNLSAQAKTQTNKKQTNDNVRLISSLILFSLDKVPCQIAENSIYQSHV